MNVTRWLIDRDLYNANLSPSEQIAAKVYQMDRAIPPVLERYIRLHQPTHHGRIPNNVYESYQRHFKNKVRRMTQEE
jgi:hypothetical protein